MAYPLFLSKLLIRTGIARFLPRLQRLTDGGATFLHYYSDRLLAAPYPELRDAAGFREPKRRSAPHRIAGLDGASSCAINKDII